MFVLEEISFDLLHFGHQSRVDDDDERWLLLAMSDVGSFHSAKFFHYFLSFHTFFLPVSDGVNIIDYLLIFMMYEESTKHEIFIWEFFSFALMFDYVRYEL